jgi:hypothetical protein
MVVDDANDRAASAPGKGLGPQPPARRAASLQEWGPPRPAAPPATGHSRPTPQPPAPRAATRPRGAIPVEMRCIVLQELLRGPAPRPRAPRHSPGSAQAPARPGQPGGGSCATTAREVVQGGQQVGAKFLPPAHGRGCVQAAHVAPGASQASPASRPRPAGPPGQHPSRTEVRPWWSADRPRAQVPVRGMRPGSGPAPRPAPAAYQPPPAQARARPRPAGPGPRPQKPRGLKARTAQARAPPRSGRPGPPRAHGHQGAPRPRWLAARRKCSRR